MPGGEQPLRHPRSHPAQEADESYIRHVVGSVANRVRGTAEPVGPEQGLWIFPEVAISFVRTTLAEPRAPGLSLIPCASGWRTVLRAYGENHDVNDAGRRVNAPNDTAASRDRDPFDRGDRQARSRTTSSFAIPPSKQLASLTVTSVTGTARPQFTSPAATYVLTAEELNYIGVRNIPDALRYAPGCKCRSSMRYRWSISPRGFNTIAVDKLLVLVDGRSVYTPLWSACIGNSTRGSIRISIASR